VQIVYYKIYLQCDQKNYDHIQHGKRVWLKVSQGLHQIIKKAFIYGSAELRGIDQGINMQAKAYYDKPKNGNRGFVFKE
jgi:hypothetical protein